MTSEEKEITEPLPTAGDDAPGRLSREEMVDQLGVMARQIAGDAPPAVREASVVVAELTAIAARNTGPIAHILADATDDASLRLAKRLEDYAASVRQEDGAVISTDPDEEIPDSAAPETQS
ncbi:MAG: hypothetical protein U9O18_07020 [Chloroflexota bacterium]|nr:hypothetical protein [Chloroflexota bacterium]